MGQLGDGVSQAIVEIAGSDIPAMDVGDDSTGGYGGERPSHGLDPSAKHEDKIAFGLSKVGSNPGAPWGQAPRLVQRIVTPGLHLDPGINVPPVVQNLVDGVAELAQFMHPCDDKL